MGGGQTTNLFVYGTLLSTEVQKRVMGRCPVSSPGQLDGYGCYYVAGAVFPGIVREEGGRVAGRILSDLTPEEWDNLDAYEDDFYEKTAVECKVYGRPVPALTYVVPEEKRSILNTEPWSFDLFSGKRLDAYLERLQ